MLRNVRRRLRESEYGTQQSGQVRLTSDLVPSRVRRKSTYVISVGVAQVSPDQSGRRTEISVEEAIGWRGDIIRGFALMIGNA